jgi:hypothetical protein
VKSVVAHLAPAELYVRARPTLAKLEPEHSAGAARVPQRPADEWCQIPLDLLLQKASVVWLAIAIT